MIEVTGRERVAALMPLIEAGRIDELAEELVRLKQDVSLDFFSFWAYGPGESLYDTLKQMPAASRVELVTRLLSRADDEVESVEGVARVITGGISVSWTPEAAGLFLTRAAHHETYCHENLSWILECWLKAGNSLTPAQLAALRRTAVAGWAVEVVFPPLIAQHRVPLLNVGEPWADQILSEDLDEHWTALLEHALATSSASVNSPRPISSSKPSAKWQRTARALLEQAGPEAARARITGWLTLVGRPRSLPLRGGNDHYVDPYNAPALRGLIWLLGCLPPRPDTCRVLGTLAESALRKVPGVGPRHPATATSAIGALSRLDGADALGQLARLAAKVTHKPTLKVLNRALDARAKALGLPRDEVDELAVPSYGLTEVGRRVETLGEAEAELAVTAGKVVLGWRNAKGKLVKAPPASVRQEHAGELAELKGAVKDITKMLSAQADRLDRLFLAQRTWPFERWRARYLDHPLVGTLARRLIWLIGDVPYGYADGGLRDVEDAETRPAADATVRLWHPIGRDVAEVRAWRSRLERHEITQPFKQAHREVYLLTPAEERTGDYSNRFAAHVLRQHQFHALAAARGWRHELHMAVDGDFPPAAYELPGWGLRAEFWTEPDYGDAEWTESGAYLRVTTDQVRFFPPHAQLNYGGYAAWLHNDPSRVPPVPLAEIPALVFSEVMRDVDLFVGVASVGNDPTWQDGGPDGMFRDYWTSYGFGELSVTAQTRRDVLSRLLPRLAIAGRCSLEGRFLHVRGDLRTYKIHLGSGNILMTPDDRYLCIVPKQASGAVADQVFLPFEGDQTLAVILSKAMLLAKDTEITDPSITAQIRG
ncbi:DUF4132 domain-containing protein [Nonomuraea sp. NPDC049480]|uniref:DUF4132 domain-containing protein n=1 Tax=Nonomuraea sp. NPDC049480 TaxID=3364353 RepID=UPI003793B72A